MEIPTIETERLILRPFNLSDLEAYADMCSDNRFMKYLGGTTFTKAQTWENIAMIQGHWMLLGYGIWAVECSQTRELVGRAGLLNLYGWPGIEVCWALSPNHWAKGFATEAAIASIVWAFDNNVSDSLISLIHPDNIKSENVALRSGETFRELITFKGQPTKFYEIHNTKNA